MYKLLILELSMYLILYYLQGTWNTRAVRLSKLADLMTNTETG